MHVWALGLWCETPTASGPPGLHTTTRELQTGTFDGPGASKHHQKTTRRHTARETKSENGGGRRKKAQNFGHPTLRGPIFSGFRPGQKWNGQNLTNQIRMAKTGLVKVGPCPTKVHTKKVHTKRWCAKKIGAYKQAHTARRCSNLQQS